MILVRNRISLHILHNLQPQLSGATFSGTPPSRAAVSYLPVLDIWHAKVAGELMRSAANRFCQRQTDTFRVARLSRKAQEFEFLPVPEQFAHLRLQVNLVRRCGREALSQRPQLVTEARHVKSLTASLAQIRPTKIQQLGLKFGSDVVLYTRVEDRNALGRGERWFNRFLQGTISWPTSTPSGP